MKDSAQKLPDFMRIRQYVVESIHTAGGQTVQFPSTRKLAEMFNVTQPTALRAIRDLIAEGYLAPCKNGGTISVSRNSDAPENSCLFGNVAYQGRQSCDNYFFLGTSMPMLLELLSRSERFQVQNLYLESPSLLEREVRDNSLSGLILFSPHPCLTDAAGNLRKNGITVGSFMRPLDGVSSCYLDYEEYLYRMTAKLFQEGRTHLVCVHSTIFFSKNAVLRGIQRACAEYHVPEGQVIIMEDDGRENGKRLAALLDFGIKPEGLIFVMMQHPVLKMIREKLDTEEQCRLVCDEFSACQDIHFTGYVMTADLKKAAKILTDNLLDQLQNPKAEVLSRTIDFSLPFYRGGVPEQQSNERIKK